MKKNVKIRIITLIIASAVLCSALTVAAVMGSPYETLKKALLDALTYRNATVEGQATIIVNGEVYDEQKSFYITGDNGSVNYYFDQNGNPDGYSYLSDSLNIYRDYMGKEGTQWYSANITPGSRSPYSSNYYGGPFAVFSPEDRDSARMRFFEMAADALIGDIKNNITMSSEGGVRYIQGTLAESQVPEIIQTGIDVFIESSSNTYYDWRVSIVNGEYVQENIRIYDGMKTVSVYKQAVRPMTAEEQKKLDDGTFDYGDEFYGNTYVDGIGYIFISPGELVSENTTPCTIEDFEGSSDPLNNIPIESLTLNYLHGEAAVDAEGNLLSLDFGATVTAKNILGDTNVIEINGSARFTDIGTSKTACPIPGAEQLLTPEYMNANFGREYGSVYFTLNEDGSINADSVTTTYPGEYERSAEDTVIYTASENAVMVNSYVIGVTDDIGDGDLE